MSAHRSDRRHIAVFINDMNAAGGIQRVAANLARDLQPKYRTTLLTVEPLESPVFQEPGLEFSSLNYRRNPRSHLKLLKELVQVGLRLRRFVAQRKIDTVLAIWYDWASVAAFALPRSVKKIGCEHMTYSEATRTWRLIRSRSYPRLDAVVGLTFEDLPRLQKISRLARVIPNYARVADAPLPARENILLTVGHLDGRKGLDRLLWALKQPLMDHPEWKLVVIGGGEKGHADWGYLDYVSTLIQLLQLQGRVEFYPATEQIGDWYRRASIYVLGSRREGLPMVLIEAKAYGLPIVSFDCPTGPREVVRTGVDGFLIENDSLAFARAADALMRDSDLREHMGAAAIQDFRRRFSPDVVLSQWSDLIELLHGDRAVADVPSHSTAAV